MSRKRDDRAVDGDADVLRIDFRAATERVVDVGLDLTGRCARLDLNQVRDTLHAVEIRHGRPGGHFLEHPLDRALEREEPVTHGDGDSVRHAGVVAQRVTPRPGDVGIGPLAAQHDLDVVGHGADAANPLDRLFGGQLRRVTVHESGERDDAVRRDDGDVVRVDLRIPLELPLHGVVQLRVRLPEQACAMLVVLSSFRQPQVFQRPRRRRPRHASCRSTQNAESPADAGNPEALTDFRKTPRFLRPSRPLDDTIVAAEARRASSSISPRTQSDRALLDRR